MITAEALKEGLNIDSVIYDFFSMHCFYVLFLYVVSRETPVQTKSFLLHLRFTSWQISARDVSGLVVGQRMEFLEYLF